jgi:hypothetical protein
LKPLPVSGLSILDRVHRTPRGAGSRMSSTRGWNLCNIREGAWFYFFYWEPRRCPKVRVVEPQMKKRLLAIGINGSNRWQSRLYLDSGAASATQRAWRPGAASATQMGTGQWYVGLKRTL